MEDLTDERRHIDMRRAGPHARSIEAEEAARRLDHRRVVRQRRRHIGEPLDQLLAYQPFTGSGIIELPQKLDSYLGATISASRS